MLFLLLAHPSKNKALTTGRDVILQGFLELFGFPFERTWTQSRLVGHEVSSYTSFWKLLRQDFCDVCVGIWVQKSRASVVFLEKPYVLPIQKLVC